MKKSIFANLALSAILAVSVVILHSQTKKHQPTKEAPIGFIPFGTGLPTSGQWREGFRIADMNGDGHPDLVHGPARKRNGFPVIYLGDGKGTWDRWKDAKFPSLAYDYGDVEVADFNRDGHPDIALGIHMHGMLVLTGDGKGNFTEASTGLDFSAQGPASFSTRALRSTDWNGDGLPDLVASWEGPLAGGAPRAPVVRNGVVVFLNKGPEGWQRSEPTLSPGIFSDSIALADFDGDGHVDVATGSSVLGRKDLVNLWRAGGTSTPAAVNIPGTAHYVQAVAAGDFDNDGKADLAVSYLSLENELWYAVTELFYSRPDGKWERKTLFKEESREGAVALATGHLRGKGSARDLVALTTKGETILYLGDGHGGFDRNVTAIPVYDGGCRGAHVELADLDGDGKDEIVASFADEPAGFGSQGPVCRSNGGITAWKLR